MCRPFYNRSNDNSYSSGDPDICDWFEAPGDLDDFIFYDNIEKPTEPHWYK